MVKIMRSMRIRIRRCSTSCATISNSMPPNSAAGSANAVRSPVILDGTAVLSCVTPLLLLEGKQVTTLEGLGTIEAPAPIQRAFMEEQAAQCGYCIAGMMMRAQALLQS